MNFITIDFETATSDRSTPCEIGLTFVEDNQVVETKSWLIKPHCYPLFDPFNITIHGITPEDVKDAPEFNELWNEIQPLIKGKLLFAHNAAFDFSVLRKTLDAYDLPYPDLNYACSYIMAKNIWKGLPSYNLKSLCNQHNIKFKHHRAAADSRATAELLIKSFDELGVTNHNEFKSKLHLEPGSLSSSDYKPCHTVRTYYKKVNFSNVISDTSSHDKDCAFYGRTVVFTGKLLSMERASAQKIILSIGGKITDGVTKETDYLVVGHQDYRYVGETGMSSKQKKAVNMISNGAELEILSEDDFLKSINGKWNRLDSTQSSINKQESAHPAN